MSEFTQSPPAVAPPKKDNTTVIVVTALITAAVTSVLWIGIGILIYSYQMAEPPPFTLEVEVPEVVVLDETMQIVATVTNHSEETATLGSMDITGELMEGFQLASVSPEPSSQTAIFGIHSFYSKHKLGPSESVTFTFSLKAVETGYWAGSIDACTPMEKFVSEWIEVEVVEELPDEEEAVDGEADSDSD